MTLVRATKICPTCLEPWVRWAGSKLQGHARCHFTPAQQDELLRRFDADPKLTIAKLARELDVSTGVVRASLHEAAKRQGRRSFGL
jgi:hypothetical protein